MREVKDDSILYYNLQKIYDDVMNNELALLKLKIKNVEDETMCKVLSVTEVVKPYENFNTYKLLLDNDTVKTVITPKTNMLMESTGTK